MTTRTSKKTVTFNRPFFLGDFDEVLPAGEYDVETDEELLEGISFPAYRRVLTVVYLHSRSRNPNLTRALTIDPNELDAALLRDQAPPDVLFFASGSGQTRDGTNGLRHLAHADGRSKGPAEGEEPVARPGHTGESPGPANFPFSTGRAT